MRKIQLHKSVTSSEVQGESSLQDVLNYIRQHDPEAERIKNLPKKQYDNSKKFNLLAASFTYKFSKNRGNINIIAPTGYMYFDIDGIENLEDSVFSHPLVHAKWKSLSGKGVGFLVRIDNLPLDKNSYANAHAHIEAKLGFCGQEGLKLDKQAKKMTQCTILPNDPNLYFNSESIVIDYNLIPRPTVIDTVSKAKVSRLSKGKNKRKKEKEHFALTPLNYLVRPRDSENKRMLWFDNKHHFNLEDEVFRAIYKEESAFIQVGLFGYKLGNRNTSVAIALTNAAWLNCGVPMKDVTAVIYEMMDKQNADNLDEDEFKAIVRKIEIRRGIEVLEPVASKQAYFMVCSEDVSGYQARGMNTTNFTKGKIISAMLEWSTVSMGAVFNQTQIAKYTGVSRQTVNKYWKECINVLEDKNKRELMAKKRKKKRTNKKIVVNKVHGKIDMGDGTFKTIYKKDLPQMRAGLKAMLEEIKESIVENDENANLNIEENGKR